MISKFYLSLVNFLSIFNYQLKCKTIKSTFNYMVSSYVPLSTKVNWLLPQFNCFVISSLLKKNSSAKELSFLKFLWNNPPASPSSLAFHNSIFTFKLIKPIFTNQKSRYIMEAEKDGVFKPSQVSNNDSQNGEEPKKAEKKKVGLESGKNKLSFPIRENGRFINPWNTWQGANVSILSLRNDPEVKNARKIPSQTELDKVLPVLEPEFSETPLENGVTITWIGHSTCLVQFDGITIITDPIFSQRCSPVQFIGPKRYRKPACNVADLPENLNAVVISHNHYDHLDYNSVKQINQRYGSRLHWFVPMGLKKWFDSLSITNVNEMDWWEEKYIENEDVKFVFTPTQHWSKRGLYDYCTTLWGSWTIIGPKNRFFFTGDTGYCPVFKEIGDIYGPFTVAAIPIGAYLPRSFMHRSHINPEEAVLIHQDLKSKFSFGIHWGTFPLSWEYCLDPPLKVKEALEKYDIPVDQFIAFKHGETKHIPSNQ